MTLSLAEQYDVAEVLGRSGSEPLFIKIFLLRYLGNCHQGSEMRASSVTGPDQNEDYMHRFGRIRKDDALFRPYQHHIEFVLSLDDDMWYSKTRS